MTSTGSYCGAVCTPSAPEIGEVVCNETIAAATLSAETTARISPRELPHPRLSARTADFIDITHPRIGAISIDRVQCSENPDNALKGCPGAHGEGIATAKRRKCTSITLVMR